MSNAITDNVLTLTDAARARILELRAGESDAEKLALVVEVTGQTGDSYTYDLYFQVGTDGGAGDWTGMDGDLQVVVRRGSIEQLRGAVLELDDEGGLLIRNPNQPPRSPASPSMGGPPVDLSGDVPQRVLQVLEQQINPAIAAHGGRADLVAVEDDVAYLRLSGGCAGCGMAAVTLSQGIEVAVVDAVPEISRIVDVTDHAAGANPYYEPAKK